MVTRPHPSFDVRLDDPTDTLIIGTAEYGLAGLTAADYLTTELELKEAGHIAVDGLPAITPFENGTPRRHTRLFSRSDIDLTVLVGELPVPPFAAAPFADAIASHGEEYGTKEIVILSGVPFPHGPDDHRPFYVATEEYQANRLSDVEDISPMVGGFLEGFNAELMDRALDESIPVCVLTTPVHALAPDIEAALRILEVTDRIYDLNLDTEPLETFAENLSQQYEKLAARLETEREEHIADDRMYM